jgi:hypothetical protein
MALLHLAFCLAATPWADQEATVLVAPGHRQKLQAMTNESNATNVTIPAEPAEESSTIVKNATTIKAKAKDSKQQETDKSETKKAAGKKGEAKKEQEAPAKPKSKPKTALGDTLEANIATKFESAKCRAALKAANRSDWERIGGKGKVSKARQIGGHSKHMEEPFNHGVFIRNLGAASDYVLDSIEGVFQLPVKEFDAKQGRVLMRGTNGTEEQEDKFGYQAADDTFVFTTIADPIQIALAGYREILRRNPDGKKWGSENESHSYREYAHEKYTVVRRATELQLRGAEVHKASNDSEGSTEHRWGQFLRVTNIEKDSAVETWRNWLNEDGTSVWGKYENSLNLRWRGLKCDSPEAALQKFEAYLDALEARSELGSLAKEAYPQAFKLDIVLRSPRYDAIIKVEHLNSSLKRLAQAVGVDEPSVPEPKQAGWLDDEPRPDGYSCAKVDLTGNNTLAVSLRKRLCDMYAVDYACFGYVLPPGCGWKDDQ